MREQQLLQREQQLHQERLLEQRWLQQCQPHLQLQMPVQQFRREQQQQLQSARPPHQNRPQPLEQSQLQESPQTQHQQHEQQQSENGPQQAQLTQLQQLQKIQVDHPNRQQQLQPEQRVDQEQPHQNESLQSSEHLEAFRKDANAYSEPHDLSIETGERKLGQRRRTGHEQEHQEAPVMTGPLSSRWSRPVQSLKEETGTGSPIRKKQRKQKIPAVLFSAVDKAHDSPIQRACFLPDTTASDAESPPALLLLTASDGCLKIWDIERMATKWRYTVKGTEGRYLAESPTPFWGLAPAVGGSLIVAGIGSCIQIFDARGEQ